MGEKAEILSLERSPCSCQVEGLNWLQRHILDEAMRAARIIVAEQLPCDKRSAISGEMDFSCIILINNISV